MSVKRFVEGYATAWESHDVEKIASYYTDNCVYENLALGVVNRGKEEVNAFINASFAAYPDLKFEVKSFFVSGLARLGFGKVVGEWVMSGTHTGDFRGLPATGKSFSVRGVTIDEVHKGKIRRHSDYYDRACILRQLGVSSL